MHHVMDLKTRRKEHLLGHGFYDWVRSDRVSLEDRLLFAPIMAIFVMNFRDANKWFIRFPTPRSQFEEIINGNTFEDETHSRLFLEDWTKLRLDEKLGWGAADTLWWLFSADDTEPFRRFVFEFARMCVVDRGDPLIRFAHSEAGEACGNAFFSVLAPVASEVEAKTRIPYRYFGHHHLDREPGHVLESPGVFESQVLDEGRRSQALGLATKMFDVFEEMHDCFLRYAETYTEQGRVPRRPESPWPALRDEETPSTPSAPLSPMAPLHGDVERALLARKAKAASHPLYAWMRDEAAVSPIQKLQRFIPMWLGDIMGYRELNRYAIRYPQESGPQEAAINRWCDDLETHNGLFLRDWDQLGMDHILGWRAHDTLKFCFLDKQMDVHRKNMATFTKLAMGHSAPALRFWLLEALEASGHAFFENTKRLAREVEKSDGLRLDYLGDRHDLAHPAERARLDRRAVIAGEPLSAPDRDIAIGMVDTVFDALEEQLGVSLDVAKSNKFGVK
jgi:hypothetical protein